MTPLHTAMQRTTMAAAARRFASSTTSIPKKPAFVPKNYDYSTKQAWFSDSATYPLIIIMGTAGAFMVGCGAYALNSYKGVRLLPSHKHDSINSWDTFDRKGLAKTLGSRPMGYHASQYKEARYEGLGIKHDDWVKSRKEEK